MSKEAFNFITGKDKDKVVPINTIRAYGLVEA
jgi:hypothetical protein